MKKQKPKKAWAKPAIKSLSIKGLTLGGLVGADLEKGGGDTNKRIS